MKPSTSTLMSARATAPAATAVSFKGTLLLLQNKTKRDPESYYEEFQAQLRHFDALSRVTMTSSRLGAATASSNNNASSATTSASASGGGIVSTSAAGVFGHQQNNNNQSQHQQTSKGGQQHQQQQQQQQNHQQENNQFCDVLLYLCHVSHCYPKECAHIPDVLLTSLQTSGTTMDPLTRRTFVQCLILLRSKGLVSPDKTMPVLFDLLLVRDKTLRKLVLAHIVSDIRSFNQASDPSYKKKKSNSNNNNDGKKKPKISVGQAQQYNRIVQNFLFSIVQQDDPTQTRCALLVILDLYRRGVWANERCVEVVAQACMSKHTRIIRTSLRFFLMQFPKVGGGGAGGGGSDDDDQEDLLFADAKDVTEKMTRAMHKYKSKGKTKKRDRVLKKTVKTLKKKLDPEKRAEALFARQQIDPVRLLRDPQTFSEKLFAQLQKTSERFEIRLLFLSVLSRIIAEHQVVVLSLYSYLERFLQPSQIQAPTILALAATCVHSMIPPDYIEPLVKSIANHFVNDRSQPDAITIGLNTIREICKRQPLAMNADLLKDLVEYKSMRGERGIIMAARSLIQLFRIADPGLLPSKLRGGADGDQPKPTFGTQKPLMDIPGMEMLYGEDEDEEGQEEEEGDEGESGSDASSSMIEIDMSSDEDDDQAGNWNDWEVDEEENEELLFSDEDEDEDDEGGQNKKKKKNNNNNNNNEDEEMNDDDEEDEEGLDDLEFFSDEELDDLDDDANDEDQAYLLKGKRSRQQRQSDQEDVWGDDSSSDHDDQEENQQQQQQRKQQNKKIQKEARGGKIPQKSRRVDNDDNQNEDENDDDSAPPRLVSNSAVARQRIPTSTTTTTTTTAAVSTKNNNSNASSSSSSVVGGWYEDTAPNQNALPLHPDAKWKHSSHHQQYLQQQQQKNQGVAFNAYEDENTTTGRQSSAAPSSSTRGGGGKTPSISSSAGTSKSISALRILTDEDFEKLRKIQEGLDPNDWRSARGRKKALLELKKQKSAISAPAAAAAAAASASLGDVGSSAIESFTKKKRSADKEEKIAEAQEARKARQPFNVRKKAKRGKAHSTNTEKSKHGKLFQMVKRSFRVGQKMKMSVEDRREKGKEMKKKNIKFRINRGWKT